VQGVESREEEGWRGQEDKRAEERSQGTYIFFPPLHGGNKHFFCRHVLPISGHEVSG
jgi:hypothetical protein